MKRILTVILLVILVSLLFIVVAEEPTGDVNHWADDFEYIILEDGTAEITGYSGNAEDLIVPAELGGKQVSRFGDYAFAFNDYLTKVTIPNSEIIIGDHAFVNCRNLISVSIPNSVTSIGDSVFHGCFKMT